MTDVFADTWYYLSLLNPNDPGHARAARRSEATERVVTTDYVLVELGNALSAPAWRSRLVALADVLRTDTRVTLVPASADLLDRGLRLFGQRLDKSWSLTDCISFVVMRDRGLTEALTADHHFEQAGFRSLLTNDS